MIYCPTTAGRAESAHLNHKPYDSSRTCQSAFLSDHSMGTQTLGAIWVIYLHLEVCLHFCSGPTKACACMLTISWGSERCFEAVVVEAASDKGYGGSGGTILETWPRCCQESPLSLPTDRLRKGLVLRVRISGGLGGTQIGDSPRFLGPTGGCKVPPVVPPSRMYSDCVPP